MSYLGWITAMPCSPTYRRQLWHHSNGSSMPRLIWWWIWDHVTRWHLLCVSSTGCRSNRGFSSSCVFSSTMPSVADHQATSPNWWSLWRTSRVDPHSVRPRDMICLFHDQTWCRPKGHSLLQHERPGIDFRWILDSLRTPDCLKNSWRPFYSVRLILPLHSQLDPFLPLLIACYAFVCLTLYMSCMTWMTL